MDHLYRSKQVSIMIEIIFIILFTLAFALHEKFRIKDEQTPDEGVSQYLKRQWHKYKGAVQAIVFSYVSYAVFKRTGNVFYTFSLTIFLASFFWFFHDGILNKALFVREWFFVGTTAAIDKILQKSGKPYVIAGIIKTILLVGSVILLVIKTNSSYVLR
jgi:hypothetical protein